MNFLKKSALAFAAVVSAGSLMANDGGSTVTIPETGVDIAAFATEAITVLGGVVAVVVGGVVAFMLVRAGLRWLRSLR